MTFETTYTAGEYYSPIDIIIIAYKKIKRLNIKNVWLFLPRLILFVLALFFSLLNFPIFLICKIFKELNGLMEDSTFFAIILSIPMFILNFFYMIAYYIYMLLNIFGYISADLYQRISPKVFHFPIINMVKPEPKVWFQTGGFAGDVDYDWDDDFEDPDPEEEPEDEYGQVLLDYQDYLYSKKDKE